jgi:hypothetical protein
MKVKFDDKKLMHDLNNIVAYSNGFCDGVILGKPKMLNNLGELIKELAGEYIDANARMNPKSLHHVYEWYQVGSPSARLFDIHYLTSGQGLSFNSTFRQSSSVKAGSSKPFYNKAKIMEEGISVTIKPVSSKVLAFNVDGKDVFTPNAVVVDEPGGADAHGEFYENFRSFFLIYLSQALMDVSGLSQTIKNPITFKTNIRAGASGGRSVGVKVGMEWISKVGK